MIPLNKPFVHGSENTYIAQALNKGHLCANGFYTDKCERFFEKKYGYKKCFLTTSCTDALELTALLLNIKPGDEVIVPSYTYVSTANAFCLRGATIVFADSRSDHPGIDEEALSSLITPNTKAIVVVHYAGVACNMEPVLKLAEKHGIYVVEDAAHSLDAFYLYDNQKLPLGSLGHFATFSFHETKNITAGEAGMLVINRDEFISRAEVLLEKGTNRRSFNRGEHHYYEWIDIGSSYQPAEIVAAFLYAQLQQLDEVQKNRMATWSHYYEELKELAAEGFFKLPSTPPYATQNAHIFYLLLNSIEQRDLFIEYLRLHGVQAAFHYVALHGSHFGRKIAPTPSLPNAERYSHTLVRLPLFYGLSETEVKHVVSTIKDFYKGK